MKKHTTPVMKRIKVFAPQIAKLVQAKRNLRNEKIAAATNRKITIRPIFQAMYFPYVIYSTPITDWMACIFFMSCLTRTVKARLLVSRGSKIQTLFAVIAFLFGCVD